MKSIVFSLKGKSIILLFALSALIFTSCSKGGSPVPTPDPPPMTPPVLVAPKLTATVPTVSLWYDGSVTVTWASTDAVKVTVNGVNEALSGEKIISNVKADTEITIVATSKDGLVKNYTATVPVYSKTITNLCKYGEFRCVQVKLINETNGATTYPSITTDNVTFHANGVLSQSVKNSSGEWIAYPNCWYKLSNGESVIEWNGVGNNFEIKSLSQTELVIYQRKQALNSPDWIQFWLTFRRS